MTNNLKRSSDSLESKSRNRWTLQRLVPLILLAGVILVGYLLGWHQYLTLENVAENRDQLVAYVNDHYGLSILIFALLYMTVVATSLPGGLLLTVTGGFLFGAWAGTLTTVISATTGATLVFLIARSSLGTPLLAKAGPKLNRMKDGFSKDAMNYLLFLRLVPLFPFWLVNLAPAFLGVRLKTYVTGTFIGIIPGTFAFSYAGTALDSIIQAQQTAYTQCQQSSPLPQGCQLEINPSALITTELLVAFCVLGVIALVPIIYRKMKQGRK